MGAPWFKLFPAQYLADSKVRMLSREHRSILLDLWCYCSQDGSIPSDLNALSRLIGEPISTTRKAMDNLASFFVVEGDRLYSTRLRIESAAYDDKCQKLRESASKGGKQKAANAVANGTHENVANAKANAKANDLANALANGLAKPAEAEAEEEKEVPPLAPKGAPAEPAPQGKPKRTPRKPLQSEDCTAEVLPHVQAVYKLVPKMHPVSGEEVHKGPFATAARAIQRLVDEQALTPKEAEWVGRVYYTAEELEAEFPEAMRGLVQAVSNAWDTRPKAMMQVSTLFGPDKKPWAQLLPVARKAMARVPVLLEVSA